jgi:hypothetical protein
MNDQAIEWLGNTANANRKLTMQIYLHSYLPKICIYNYPLH